LRRERFGELCSLRDRFARLAEHLLPVLVRARTRDDLESFGERDTGRDEGRHLAREVHDLGPLDALLRDVDREDALAHLLELLHIEVAFEERVAREGLADGLELVFDRRPVLGDGGVAEA